MARNNEKKQYACMQMRMQIPLSCQNWVGKGSNEEWGNSGILMKACKTQADLTEAMPSSEITLDG